MTEENMLNEEMELTDEELELVTGGTSADYNSFLALAQSKGWGDSSTVSGRKAAAKMYAAIGMVKVNWHAGSSQAAQFWDGSGNVYTYSQIKPKLKALPNK